MAVHLRQTLVKSPARNHQMLSDAVSKHHKKQKIIIILCVIF
jgi:hypothetical protein